MTARYGQGEEEDDDKESDQSSRERVKESGGLKVVGAGEGPKGLRLVARSSCISAP
jgi:hypothetical protein